MQNIPELFLPVKVPFDYYKEIISNYKNHVAMMDIAKMEEDCFDVCFQENPASVLINSNEKKVLTLLTVLKRNGIITADSDNKRISHGGLANNDESV